MGFSGRRLLSAFVVIEVALSLVLLIGAGLMIKSFIQIQNVNPGFVSENVLTANITLPAPNIERISGHVHATGT